MILWRSIPARLWLWRHQIHSQDLTRAVWTCSRGSTCARPIPPAACACGHPSDDHDDEGACMHLCDCAWPIPPGEGDA